jgi:hypothetical protein
MSHPEPMNVLELIHRQLSRPCTVARAKCLEGKRAEDQGEHGKDAQHSPPPQILLYRGLPYEASYPTQAIVVK